ncbi:long-chain-fatty-acid--CoA ligase [Dactylosporangium sp. CA-092794]|uniref:long-chain-fatty-acid--CoA ligase n=1 Tax=Dactylosporangium sp. CA-092794 TaxID=3239929 RepID=UPI003D8B5036
MTSLSLASLLAEPARRWPDHTALVEGATRVTYAELWRDARAVAASLAAKDVAPGDRVALLAPNVVDFVRSYFGILAAGAVVVPVPTLLNAAEAAQIVRDSGAGTVLHHGLFAAVGAGAAQAAGAAAYDIAGLGEDHEPLPTFVTRQAEDLAVIFYTSGTTGAPKGALLTQVNLVMNATTNAFDSNGLVRNDTVFGALPLFHTFGQTVAMGATFRVGARLVLQPRFNAAEALELMVAEGVTRFLGVPTMFIQLLRAAEERLAGGRPLPRLTSCTSGGSAMPVAVLEEFQRVFDTAIYEGYGLSETSPTAAVNQKVFGTRPGTVGHAIWGVEVEIADAGVADRIVLLPSGEIGEIVVRGHNVFAGYLDRPEATGEALVEGWFRTGDIGTKDADGFITIVDRRKDVIIRSGFNVYPREVEEVLARHPDIGQVAVIGIPDTERGEEVCAVVVARPGHEIDVDALRAWGREQLAHHKYPRLVHVLPELPMGPSQKVLKRDLRARFTQ